MLNPKDSEGLTLPEFHNLLETYYRILQTADQETLDRGFPYLNDAKTLHNWMQDKLGLDNNFGKKQLMELIRQLQTDVMTSIRQNALHKAAKGYFTPPAFRD